MKLILLSGGSGKRLWPLSNDARSKQFLKILASENGYTESMVQRVWRQLSTIGLHQDTYIATSPHQSEILYNQLGSNIKLIIEPERRDTFPAIALASSYLFDIEQVCPDEIVCVLPVDPYVDLDYFEKLKKLCDLIEAGTTDIALLGVKPTYPSEKYGYIMIQDNCHNQGFHFVEQFIEKPNKQTAQDLITRNALWNCGVFAFKLEFMINYLTSKEISVKYEAIKSNYSKLPSISFDYEVVEKLEHLCVVPYDGGWKDLGTWNTVTEEISQSVIGKGKMDSDCSNTHIINELDIPIYVLGISDSVIAASPDGILVSDKASSPKLKELVDDNKLRPMYEERLWGWHRILDYSKNELGQEILTKHIGISSGKNLSYQIHHSRKEIWTIISGTGECVLDGRVISVMPGDVITILAGTKHAIRALRDLELIEVQIGYELIEEDIYREATEWQDILEQKEPL